MEAATRSMVDDPLAIWPISNPGSTSYHQPDSLTSLSEPYPSSDRFPIPNEVDHIEALFVRYQNAIKEWLQEHHPGHKNMEPTDLIHPNDNMSMANKSSLTGIKAEGTFEDVTATLDAMFHERTHPVMVLLQRALAALADILRYGASNLSSNLDFRGSFGDSGIVKFCLEVIKHCNDLLRERDFQIYERVLHQALRIVGNSVISHDQNRARVVEGNYTKPMTDILMQTKSVPALNGIHTAALSVLNNVCTDNKPAQEQVIQNEIIPILCQTLQSGDDGEIHVAANLTEMVSKHSQSLDSSPNHILDKLVKLALRRHIRIDEFLTLTTAMLNYLKSERFQEHFIEIGAIERVHDLICHQTLQQFDDDLPEEKEELAQNCLALVSAISDCFDLPSFDKRYTLLATQKLSGSMAVLDPGPQLKDQLVQFISSRHPGNMYVQLLGCILAGNFASSEESCRVLLDGSVHNALVRVTLESEDGRVLHSALGALKNLAIPSPLRERLAESDIFNGASRIWDMSTMPQVQLSSVTLVRLLCTKCVTNITNHLLRSSAAISSLSTDGETCLSSLLALFSRTDSLPIKLEIGRTIAEVLRCLGSVADLDQGREEAAYHRFFTHKHLVRPIAAMLTQSQYPPVRSEAFFTLALLSRRKEGCIAIQELLRDAQAFEVLVDTITRKSSKETKDMENAIVMASELVKNRSDESFVSAEEVEKLVQGVDVGKVYQKLEQSLESMKR